MRKKGLWRMDNGLDSLEEAAAIVQVNQIPVDTSTDEELERLELLENERRRAKFRRENPHLFTDGE